MPDFVKNLFSGPVIKGLGGFITVATAVIGTLVGLGVIHGSGGGQDQLAAAAVKTSDAGSSRIDLSRTIRAGSTVVEQQAKGEFDYRAVVGKLDYTDGSKQILLRPYIYELLPDQTIWCQYDLSALGPGLFFGAITGFKNDPGAVLVNLKESGSSKKVGEETIFGVVTTHYAGYVDLARLSQRESNPDIRKLIQEFQTYNSGKLPVDVWVGSDDLVRRIKTAFDVPGEPYGLSGRVHIGATFDLSNFGIKVSVKPPPASMTAPGGKQGCPDAP